MVWISVKLSVNFELSDLIRIHREEALLIRSRLCIRTSHVTMYPDKLKSGTVYPDKLGYPDKPFDFGTIYPDKLVYPDKLCTVHLDKHKKFTIYPDKPFVSGLALN